MKVTAAVLGVFALLGASFGSVLNNPDDKAAIFPVSSGRQSVIHSSPDVQEALDQLVNADDVDKEKVSPTNTPNSRKLSPRVSLSKTLYDHASAMKAKWEETVNPALQSSIQKLTGAIQSAVDKTQRFWGTVPGYLQAIAPSLMVLVNVLTLLVLLSILYVINKYVRMVRRLAVTSSVRKGLLV